MPSRAALGAAVPFPKGDGLSTGSLQHLRVWELCEPWSLGAPPGCAPVRARSTEVFGGQDFGGAVAAVGQEAGVESLLNILPFASCFVCTGVQGTVSPGGKNAQKFHRPFNIVSVLQGDKKGPFV